VINNSTIIAFFTLAIFSGPLISAPQDTFAIACGKVLHSTWDTGSEKTITTAHKGKFYFEYTNEGNGVDGTGVYHFGNFPVKLGSIPMKPLHDRFWFDHFYRYYKSTETHHFFGTSVNISLPNAMKINRQTLEITVIYKVYDWKKLIRYEFTDKFSSCELIDREELDQAFKIENEDHINWKKELKEKLEKREADIKSKQKI